MAERRNATRVNFAAKATIFVANRQVACWIVDISAQGALLMPLEKVAPQQYARINMVLPGLEEVLDVDAVVVRETVADGRYAVGVQFASSDRRTETLIRTYVSWVLAQTGGAAGGAASEPARSPAPRAPGRPATEAAAATPKTAAPTTAAPKTAASTTAAPTTAAPKTAAPKTAAPKTAAPKTAAPKTAAPTTTVAAIAARRVPALPSTGAPSSPTGTHPRVSPAASQPAPPEDPMSDEPVSRVELRDLYRLALDNMKEKQATPTAVQSTIRSLLGIKRS